MRQYVKVYFQFKKETQNVQKTIQQRIEDLNSTLRDKGSENDSIIMAC